MPSYFGCLLAVMNWGTTAWLKITKSKFRARCLRLVLMMKVDLIRSGLSSSLSICSQQHLSMKIAKFAQSMGTRCTSALQYCFLLSKWRFWRHFCNSSVMSIVSISDCLKTFYWHILLYDCSGPPRQYVWTCELNSIIFCLYSNLY